VSALLLLDGGHAIPPVPEAIVDELVDAMVEAALEQARLPFGSAEERVRQWRAHPAFAENWNADVEAYARYGLVSEPGSSGVAVAEAAVRADIADLTRDEAARAAVDRVVAPVTFLRARRPASDMMPAVPQPLLDIFVASHPNARVEQVADANHYTLVLGAGPGPGRVAAAIAAAVPGDA
jgi:hypothetical protein